MKTRRFIFTLLTVMALTACSNDNETVLPDGSDRVALQVTSGIQTRVIGSNWQKDDAIGIYMFKSGSTAISESAANRRYANTDGSTSFTTSAEQTIYFPIDGSKVDFVAYYPYQQTLNEGLLDLDVSNQTNLAALDLMTAEAHTTDAAPLDKEHAAVMFNFSHSMTKLRLDIVAGTGITAAEMKGMKVEITNQRTHGTYNPELEAFGVDAGTIRTVTMHTNADGTSSEAILLPNTDTNGINKVVAGREIVFTLSTGETMKWSVPDTKLFKMGDCNTYKITLNRTGVEVTATISDWNNVNGGNSEAY